MSTTLASGANTTITLPAGQVLYTGKTGNGTAVIGPGPQANQTFTLGTGARIGPYGNDVSVFLTSTQGAIDYQVGSAPGVPSGVPMAIDPLGPILSSPDASPAVRGGARNLRPYIGIVATKCVAPTHSDLTNKQILSRTPHRALENLSAVSVAWANWWCRATGAGEAGLSEAAGYAGADTTQSIQAVIEYPAGTVHARVNFSGSFSGSILERATIWGAATVSIPEGATFWIQSRMESAAGIVYSDEGGGITGEAAQYAPSGVPALTTSGAISIPTNTLAGQAARPLAIVGLTAKPTFALITDSRGVGPISRSGSSLSDSAMDAADDLYQGRGEFERGLIREFGTLRLGCVGEQISTVISGGAFGARYTERAKLLAYTSDRIVNLGINDTNVGGRLATAVAADHATLYGLAGGRCYTATLPPVTTSTDNWATVANQGIANPAREAERVAFNGLARRGIAGASGFVEIADAVESSRDSGRWKADGTTAKLFTYDGTHDSASGCREIAKTPWTRPLHLYYGT